MASPDDQPTPAPDDESRPSGHHLESSDEANPFDLESHDDASRPAPPREEPGDSPPDPRSGKLLDVCPNCGANMPEPNAIVCVRCGFDQKTLEIITPKAEAEHVETDSEDAPPPGEGLCRPGLGGWQAPLIVAGVAAVIMLIGFLVPMQGLYPSIDFTGQVEGQATEAVVAGDKPGFLQRIDAFGRYLILVTLWIGAGMAALIAVTRLNELRLVDVRLAAARMTAMIAVMSLVTFLDFRLVPVERIVELLGQVAIFIGLSMALFRVTLRDAGIMTVLLVAFRYGALLLAWLVVQTGW